MIFSGCSSLAPLTLRDFKQLSGRLEDSADVQKKGKQFAFRLKNQLDSAGATRTHLQDMEREDHHGAVDADAQGKQGPNALDKEAYRIRKCTLEREKSFKSAAVSQ